jgi:hypothetical protein
VHDGIDQGRHAERLEERAQAGVEVRNHRQLEPCA